MIFFFFKIPPSTSRTRDSRGGIFTIKIPTFSGKTAEKVMGVYGIDCPAIFWDRECTTFWGGGRGCAGALTRPSTRHLPPKNFEKTALRKRGGIFTVKMRGGHNYGNYCTGSVRCLQREHAEPGKFQYRDDGVD